MLLFITVMRWFDPSYQACSPRSLQMPRQWLGYHIIAAVPPSKPVSSMSGGTGQAFRTICSRSHGELLLVVYSLSAVGHLIRMLEQGGMTSMSVLVCRSGVPLIVVEWSLAVLLALLFLSMLIQICLSVLNGSLSLRMIGRMIRNRSVVLQFGLTKGNMEGWEIARHRRWQGRHVSLSFSDQCLTTERIPYRCLLLVDIAGRRDHRNL